MNILSVNLSKINKMLFFPKKLGGYLSISSFSAILNTICELYFRKSSLRRIPSIEEEWFLDFVVPYTALSRIPSIKPPLIDTTIIHHLLEMGTALPPGL